MVTSAAGTWLKQSLVRLCSDVHSVIQLDPDQVASLVSYCERAPPSDAKEYLSNMIGEENCKDIVTEYLHRRGIEGPSEDDSGLEDGMHVYVKPQMDESWSAGSKKITKNLKARITVSERKISSPAADTSTGNGSSGLMSKGKTGGSKVKKGGKGVSLAEAAEGKIFISRGAPCTCQASRHKLVNNCLSCGKIICEQEGEGPCNFCGALVLLEGSTYAGLEGINVPISESEASAQAFKDRLVEYDRTSSQRTTVIDDQSDYFQVDESTWLSKEEKRAILERQEELQLAEEARKKKVVVSIDLLGRKVVMASDMENDISIKTSIFDGSPLDKRSNDVRIKPNPCILENPVFLNIRQSSESKGIRSGRRHSDLHRNDAFAKTGRVQHDDPFVSASGPSILHQEYDNINDGAWKKLKERANTFSTEDEECLMDCELKESGAAVFDICEPPIMKPLSLFPSILAKKQAERKQRMESNSAVNILMPGMVLLKHFLSQNDQVEIVKRCRSLGSGPGGFYQPSYGTTNKMHLYMMCLGMHWEPITKSYTMRRSFDNSPPPPIPSLFETLVAQCLRMARHAFQSENESYPSTRGDMGMVPDMHPNICLINFYERNGKLGLHQDKDESQESLKHGTPVVSFSIGDSAEFLYGVDRDVEAAKSVTLESGDVLIFGGPSRMIFHGVPFIHPQTAPPWLIENTDLRPGRINLTFRQS